MKDLILEGFVLYSDCRSFHPNVALVIHGDLSYSQLESLLIKYGLAYLKDDEVNISYIWCRDQEEGTHKFQAIVLFVAAIELIHFYSNLKIYIIEVGHTNYFFSTTSDITGHLELSKEFIYKWNENPFPLSIHSLVTRYLHQSGFDVKPSEVDLFWNEGEVEIQYNAINDQVKKVVDTLIDGE